MIRHGHSFSGSFDIAEVVYLPKEMKYTYVHSGIGGDSRYDMLNRINKYLFELIFNITQH